MENDGMGQTNAPKKKGKIKSWFVILECDCSPSVDYEVVYIVWSVVKVGNTNALPATGCTARSK